MILKLTLLIVHVFFIKSCYAIYGDKYNISVVGFDASNYSLENGRLKADLDFMGFSYKYDNRDKSYRRYYIKDYFFENLQVNAIDGVALVFFNPLDRAVKFSFTPEKSQLGYTRHKLDGPCITGTTFECINGMCIDKKYVMDGFNDCMDNSDEVDAVILEDIRLQYDVNLRKHYNQFLNKNINSKGYAKLHFETGLLFKILDEKLDYIYEDMNLALSNYPYKFFCKNGTSIKDFSAFFNEINDCEFGEEDEITIGVTSISGISCVHIDHSELIEVRDIDTGPVLYTFCQCKQGFKPNQRNNKCIKITRDSQQFKEVCKHRYQKEMDYFGYKNMGLGERKFKKYWPLDRKAKMYFVGNMTCESNPCVNAWQCLENTNVQSSTELGYLSDGYRCICKCQYTGKHCQHKILTCEDSPCKPMNKHCIDISHMEYTCVTCEHIHRDCIYNDTNVSINKTKEQFQTEFSKKHKFSTIGISIDLSTLPETILLSNANSSCFIKRCKDNFTCVDNEFVDFYCQCLDENTCDKYDPCFGLLYTIVKDLSCQCQQGYIVSGYHCKLDLPPKPQALISKSIDLGKFLKLLYCLGILPFVLYALYYRNEAYAKAYESEIEIMKDHFMGIGTEELEALETPGSEEIYPPYENVVIPNRNLKRNIAPNFVKPRNLVLADNTPLDTRHNVVNSVVPSNFATPISQDQQVHKALQNRGGAPNLPLATHNNTPRLTFKTSSKNLLISAASEQQAAEESIDSWDQVPLQRFRANSIGV